MTLKEIIIEADAKARAESKGDEGSYKYLLHYMMPDVQQLYGLTLRQREHDEFQKQLWVTEDLWRATQGFENLGEFLYFIWRVTDKFMKSKQKKNQIAL